MKVMSGRTLVLFLVFLLLAGCAAVSPWEREILARRSMNFNTELDENILDHGFYNAREGSAGGFQAGGGGCGCN